jgi:hypothetical protein
MLWLHRKLGGSLFGAKISLMIIVPLWQWGHLLACVLNILSIANAFLCASATILKKSELWMLTFEAFFSIELMFPGLSCVHSSSHHAPELIELEEVKLSSKIKLYPGGAWEEHISEHTISTSK